MKIYNYTGTTLQIEGITLTGQVHEIPETFRGNITIGGQPISWEDDPYQHIIITESGGVLSIDAPTVPEAPWVAIMWLMVCVFSLTLTVKILQKLKAGR